MSKGRRAPTYCNTCTEYPLTAAVKSADGTAACRVRDQSYRWDERACVLYASVKLGEREQRKRLVIAIYEKEKADAQAKNAAQAGN